MITDLYNKFLNLVRDKTADMDSYAGDLATAPIGWFQTEYNNDNIPIKQYGFLYSTLRKQVFYSEQDTNIIYKKVLSVDKWYRIKPPHKSIVAYGLKMLNNKK